MASEGVGMSFSICGIGCVEAPLSTFIVPTTTKAICRAALMSPDCTVASAWRDRVVGRFLHVSSVYFFAPLGTGNYRKQ
jgi:hypothetical protein